MPIISKQLTIKGRVQGVFYRNWSVATARGLSLVGWVRNRRNGDVEALVQGEAADVAQFIALAWTGPMAALVEDIAERPADVDDFREFEQRATA